MPADAPLPVARSPAARVVSGGDTLSRRAIFSAPAIMALAGTAACAEDGETPGMKGSKMLVAYLTRSGNTRVIAETLHRSLRADLFEIRPAHPYPADYEQHVAQAKRESDSGYEPPLAARVDGIAGYDEIFLGLPVWGSTAPPPIRSFLKAHDLSGRTLRPFITHGGYGVGNVSSVLARHAPHAKIEEAFVMEADQERRTLNAINGWLGRIHE